MIRPLNIGAFQHLINVPDCKAVSALKPGMGVTANRAAHTTALPTSDTAKGEVYVVFDVVRRFDNDKPSDFSIATGEYPRLVLMSSMAGFEFLIDTSVITTAYASLAAGDMLAYGTDGKLVEIADATGYFSYFKILEKNSYGGTGVRVVAVNGDAIAAAAAASTAAAAGTGTGD